MVNAKDLKSMVLRIPPDLHSKIRDLAEQERRSVNQQATLLLETGLEQKEGDE